MKIIGYKKGVTIIEAVIAIAVFAILVSVSYKVHVGLGSLLKLDHHKSKALWLAEEGVEATRSIRDNSFSGLVNGVNGLALSSGVCLRIKFVVSNHATIETKSRTL